MSQQNNSAGRIIFLNGTSSSGKTTIARTLQETLDEPYLRVSVDDFLSSNLTVVQGDVFDADSVASAVADHDAAISE